MLSRFLGGSGQSDARNNQECADELYGRDRLGQQEQAEDHGNERLKIGKHRCLCRPDLLQLTIPDEGDDTVHHDCGDKQHRHIDCF